MEINCSGVESYYLNGACNQQKIASIKLEKETLLLKKHVLIHSILCGDSDIRYRASILLAAQPFISRTYSEEQKT